MTPEPIDIRFMKEALKEAQWAFDRNEVPVGAILVANGTIIGRGHNLTETMQDVTAHAEMMAITAASEELGSKYLDSCTLYVTVEPCIMCAGAIGWSQIRRVVYGASDPKRGFLTFAPKALHPKCECIGGLMQEECAKLMTSFFKRKR